MTVSQESTSETEFPWLPPEFVVFDLETTGLSSRRNKIIEFGAIKFERGRIREGTSVSYTAYQRLVRIRGHVPVEITELTGITTEMLYADGVPLEDALSGFLEFVGGLPMVAYNAPFDEAFLRAALPANRALKNEMICALSLVRQAAPGLRSYSLATLSADLKVGASHRSIADCVRAFHAFLWASKKLHRYR